MAAKIQIKNDGIHSFGGLFFIIDQFRASGLAQLVDNTLDVNGLNSKYKYSNIVENLTSVYMSGGEVLEDVNFFWQEAFKANPDYRCCSADTIGRDLRGLAVENTEFQAVESGKTYQFNINDKLNDLLLNGLIQLGMVNKEQLVTFDYDNLRGFSERTFDMQTVAPCRRHGTCRQAQVTPHKRHCRAVWWGGYTSVQRVW